jgi:alpha-tubulin suppressor-like RCC1 family protein
MGDGKKMKSIAAGGYHTMALTADSQQLFVWGSNGNGELVCCVLLLILCIDQ